MVTPLMADTTTTIELSREAWRTICATRAMQPASPTEVPPNFITRSGLFIEARPATSNFSQQRRPIADLRSQPVPKDYTPSLPARLTCAIHFSDRNHPCFEGHV